MKKTDVIFTCIFIVPLVFKGVLELLVAYKVPTGNYNCATHVHLQNCLMEVSSVQEWVYGVKGVFMVIFVASSIIKFKKKCMYQTDIVKKVILEKKKKLFWKIKRPKMLVLCGVCTA